MQLDHPLHRQMIREIAEDQAAWLRFSESTWHGFGKGYTVDADGNYPVSDMRPQATQQGSQVLGPLDGQQH
jgi:hypothetical protein